MSAGKTPSETAARAESLPVGSLRRGLIILSALAFGATVWTLATPSESDAAIFLGFSPFRLALALALLMLSAACAAAASCAARPIAGRLNALLICRERLYLTLLLLWCGLGVSLWCVLFSWLFIPANLRPALVWLALAFAAAIILIRHGYRAVFARQNLRAYYRVFPRWTEIAPVQKKTMSVLLVISALYLVILLPSNLNGTRDMDAFARYGGDEYVIYPILMDVMKPGDTFGATLYHLFIYEDYHYGYPFYAVSTLILTPSRLIFGASFAERVAVNLPLLRIGVSVIPLVLACWIIVYLFTRFRRPFVSALTLIFLLFAPGSLQNNQGFWHPDGLNLLFVCLTLYFLQRDRRRFGRNFFAAAVCCGLSIATRLYGFFFAGAIGFYLIYSLIGRILDLKKALTVGLIFIAVMTLTAALASPYLFRADARARMIEIMNEKSGEMAHGYEGDYDPRNDHRPGWDAWYPAFEDHYVKRFCFWFLWATLLLGCVMGRERLTFQAVFFWCAAVTAYLVFFVAVKSTQYVLPALLPLMGAVFALPELAADAAARLSEPRRRAVVKFAWAASAAVYVVQLAANLIIVRPRFF